MGLATLIGCGPVIYPEEHAVPIIGGTTDSADPSVLALFAAQPGANQGSLCTASVIAPTVLLTAAHCVSASEVGEGAQFVGLTGNDLDSDIGSQLAVRATYPNPLWDGNDLQGGHDQGIVILAAPVTTPPLPINRRSLSSTGQSVRLIGYGLSDESAQTGAGVKRQVTTSIVGLTSTMIHIGDDSRATCEGDSGGPALMMIDGAETIVGTTSYGLVDCSDGGWDARVDSDLAFIDQYLSQACTPHCDGRSCGGDGCGGSCGACGGSDICTTDGQCAPQCAGGREQEPNNSPLTANTLCQNGIVGGTIGSATDADWFTWTVTANHNYDIRLTGAATLRAYKKSATGTLGVIADGPDVARHTSNGGTYFARITAGSGGAGASYTLTVAITD
jgi:hypothetical protein